MGCVREPLHYPLVQPINHILGLMIIDIQAVREIIRNKLSHILIYVMHCQLDKAIFIIPVLWHEHKSVSRDQTSLLKPLK